VFSVSTCFYSKLSKYLGFALFLSFPMSETAVTLIDILRIVPEIQKYFTPRESLAVQRMCHGITLDIPTVDLDFYESMRLLNFLKDYPNLEAIIVDRLRRSCIDVYVDDEYCTLLSAVPIKSLSYLKSIAILYDNEEKEKGSETETVVLDIARQASQNGVSIVWKGLNIPHDMKLLDVLTDIKEVYIFREDDPLIKESLFNSHFHKFRHMQICHDHLDEEDILLIQTKLQVLPKTEPKIDMLIDVSSFFNVDSTSELKRFQIFLEIATRVSLDFGTDEDIYRIINYFDLHPEMSRVFWSKVDTLFTHQVSTSASKKLQHYIKLARQALKTLYLEGDIFMDFRDFNKLHSVTIRRQPGNLFSENLKSLKIVEMKDFDFGSITRYRCLEIIQISSEGKVFSSVDMKISFPRLDELNIKADTQIHLGSLPPSVTKLHLKLTNQAASLPISVVIDSHRIKLEASDHEGIHFTENVEDLYIHVINQSAPEFSAYKTYPFKYLKMYDCNQVKCLALVNPTAFPNLRRIRLPNVGPHDAEGEKLFLNLVERNPALQYLSFSSEEPDFLSKFQSKYPDLHITLYGTRMEIERVSA
jgi:hypothetical protein